MSSSLNAQSGHKSAPAKSIFLTIPVELRYMIYDNLSESEQTIVLAPNVHKQSILGSFSRTCTQIDNELRIWASCKSRLTHSRIFGMFDGKLTTFELTWEMEADDFIWLHLPKSTQLRRRIPPSSVTYNNVKNLEAWQRAMTLIGGRKYADLNATLLGSEEFKGCRETLGGRKRICLVASIFPSPGGDEGMNELGQFKLLTVENGRNWFILPEDKNPKPLSAHRMVLRSHGINRE